MQSSTRPASGLGVDPDDIHDDYDRHEFDQLTDAQLFDRSAAVVAIPRQQAANSFVLHAPLELMARRLLLPLVPSRLRRAARERLVWVAARYERASSRKVGRRSVTADRLVVASREARKNPIGAWPAADSRSIVGSASAMT